MGRPVQTVSKDSGAVIIRTDSSRLQDDSVMMAQSLKIIVDSKAERPIVSRLRVSRGKTTQFGFSLKFQRF